MAGPGGSAGSPSPAARLLPPSLIHELRARSFPRLYRMAGNPGNRGFGGVLRKRIRHIAARERTLVEKAITVAYLGSYLVDHLVQAERRAVELIEKRSLTEAEEHTLWENLYGGVILQLCTELPEHAELPAAIERLAHYDRLPARLFAFRNRHWARIDRLLHRLPALPVPLRPGVCMVERIEEVLYSRRTMARKARAVLLLASLLADRLCWTGHQPWPEAYRETMIDLYPLLVRHGEVLEQVVRMDPD